MNKKIIVRYSIREAMGLIFMAAALFWSAGRINWWQGWATIGIMLLWIAATGIVIYRTNPDLFAERLGPRLGAKSWDTIIMSLLGIVTACDVTSLQAWINAMAGAGILRYRVN